MKKKVLVCGATGFIGRNIAESFAKKEELEVYGTYCHSDPWDHPDVQMLHADLTNPAEVNQVVANKDILILAAATTSGSKEIVNKPYYHVTDNAVMTSLILRSAFEHSVEHVVYFSCAIIFPSSDTLYKEEDFDANQAMHQNYFGAGWTKVYIEKMCEFYSRLGRTKHTVLRHTNVYGPYDKYDLEKSHVFGATMTKVMRANNGKIVVWGTGDEKRDFLYVKDIVDAVDLSLLKQNNSFEIYHIGYGESFTIKYLVQKIIDCSKILLSIKNENI